MNYAKSANEARKKVLEMVYKAGTSHISSNFSCIDFATVLYKNLKPRDQVVWSKGWVAATIYYFLAEQGIIPREDLDRFAKEEDGKIEYLGLAETNVPGVWCNSGAAGHGLPIAVGMALAKKMKKEEGKVYCIMSDGGLNEGTTWEAAMLAAHHKLDNLVLIIDNNGWQAMGRNDDIIRLKSGKVFESFGWAGANLNGHDYERLAEAFSEGTSVDPKPIFYICKTIKGKGVSFMENKLEWHYRNVDEEHYDKAMEELSL